MLSVESNWILHFSLFPLHLNRGFSRYSGCRSTIMNWRRDLRLLSLMRRTMPWRRHIRRWWMLILRRKSWDWLLRLADWTDEGLRICLTCCCSRGRIINLLRMDGCRYMTICLSERRTRIGDWWTLWRNVELTETSRWKRWARNWMSCLVLRDCAIRWWGMRQTRKA